MGIIKKDHLGDLQKREKEEKDTGCLGEFLKQTKKVRVFKNEKPMNTYFKCVYIGEYIPVYILVNHVWVSVLGIN